jgi:hypothetical protein
VSQTPSNQPVSVARAAAKCLSPTFNKGKWQGGYGGKAWGSIADCLLNLVTGEYSPEMFCDLAFALQHNNGSMFNKSIIRTCTLHGRVGDCT